MAIYLQSNCIVRIKSLASHDIRIVTNNLHPNCAEYRLQTWLNAPKMVRVLVLVIRPTRDKAC